jgi:hypothetical protein
LRGEVVGKFDFPVCMNFEKSKRFEVERNT